MNKRLSYASAGVDISKGELAVQMIKEAVSSTNTPGVLGSIGGFGGLFEPNLSGYVNPVLVSSTDGVGTKAYLAARSKKYDTIGIDLVAMCVDDIAVLGATPLFLLDYLSVGSLEPDVAASIVAGITVGAKECGAALLGGEMAEHPGSMPDGFFDLAGFVVGVVEKDQIWGAHRVRDGDVLIGIDSPNLRSNGFSLARAAIFGADGDSEGDFDKASFDSIANQRCEFGQRRKLIDELLDPSIIYSPILAELSKSVEIHAAAHITGGGIPGNLNRALPAHLSAVVFLKSYEVPPIFSLIEEAGQIERAEMFKVFNMGIGMVLMVPRDDANLVIEQVAKYRRKAVVLGNVTSGDGNVVLE